MQAAIENRPLQRAAGVQEQGLDQVVWQVLELGNLYC